MKVKTAVCQECGKVFEIRPSPTGRYGHPKFCYEDHHANCDICGKDFVIPHNKLGLKSARLCSPECVNKARGLLAKKSRQSNPGNKRICEACNKEFIAHEPNQRFCNRVHKITCKVCGKVFVAERWQLAAGTQTCSLKCGSILSHRTYQERYSIDNNPEAHAKLIAKMESTMMERYGFKNALSSEGKEKFHVKDRMIEKYGVDHPMKSNAIKSAREHTNIERYGSSCPATSDPLKEKSKATLIQKYGVDNYAKSTKFLSQVITDPDKADTCAEFKSDPIAFVANHFGDKKPTLLELSEVCGIRDSSVGYILDQMGHPDIVTYSYSRMEDELYTFLVSELDESTQIDRNRFHIITPYELDLYVPDLKFAIECNPTISHNSTIAGWGTNDEPKSSTYHKMKSDMCDELGIFLFHIFGYEWTHKSEIIKSMLRNILGTTPNKIFARTTEIKTVTDKEAIDFLNVNHRQGGAHSKIRLGLFHDGELVSLMTFSKMRNTIGTGSKDLSDTYELVRFCNKLNTTVVGGASKLFSYFIKNYNPSEIRSFSDRAHTRGHLYETLGFQYDHTSDPGYMWVDLKTDKGYARNNAQKKNIKSFLNDDSIDLNKTEVQIMTEYNFVQVFDSGVKLWIWRKE